jgi:hypothetical protein
LADSGDEHGEDHAHRHQRAVAASAPFDHAVTFGRRDRHLVQKAYLSRKMPNSMINLTQVHDLLILWPQTAGFVYTSSINQLPVIIISMAIYIAARNTSENTQAEYEAPEARKADLALHIADGGLKGAEGRRAEVTAPSAPR